MTETNFHEAHHFVHRLRVRYAEADSQGIVFNANYMVYFDVAVTEYFRSQYLPYTAFVARHGLDFHVAHAEIDYLKPAKFDDEIEIHLSAHCSGAKVFWQFGVQRAGETLCTGKLVYACVDKGTGKVRRIPADVADALGWRME